MFRVTNYDDWHKFHRDDLVNGGFNKYSTGHYSVRNNRIVELVGGLKFKSVVEVAGAEADLACKLLREYSFIESYLWSDFVEEAVIYAEGVVDDSRFKACRLDLDYESPDVADLFICTALEHTLRYREVVEELLSGTIVLLSLPSFVSNGHRIHFPQFTDVINVYGDLLNFIHVEIFIVDLNILSSCFILFKKILNRLGLLDWFMGLFGMVKRFERDSLRYKWIIIGVRK